ncbi:MAG: outer membrane lipoprotein-sorting protein [Thermodesulfobacteriota bacterium]
MKRWLFVLPLLLLAVRVDAEPPTADDIAARANRAAYYAGDDSRATVHMTITDRQGEKRQRQFVLLRRDAADGGEQKYYLHLEQPADLRRMVLMVHKHLDRDDDRWLYLPASSLVKRIAAGDERSGLAGSHLFYEDISGRSIYKDTHQLVQETDRFYLLKSTPKNPDKVEFSSYTVWIDKKTFLPVKSEYLDRDKRLYRRMEAMEIREIQGLPTVIRSRVEDVLSGGATVSEFSDIKYNINLPDAIFTERALRRPPRELRR